MCLVLENKGKSGSYIASRDESVGEDGDDEHGDEKDGVADSDATTDDEGAAVGANDNNSTQRNYGTATSLTTQLGEIIISKKNLSPSQTLPSLSGAIRHHFGSDTPVKLTKLDADESHVLNFDDSCNDKDDEGNDGASNSENPSMLIQFGCAQLPTIKITRIPMTVVFSSGVPSPIQNSLRLCGGILQEVGTLPRRETNGTSGTTHLVAPERMAVAKQLIAWCYGIPIVSPDYLSAIGDHSALEDPFPLPSDFPAKAADTNAFWDWTPDPKLLSGYTMISVDPSPEVEQAEGLAEAAGAKLALFYEKQKKHTKAKVQAFVKRARALLEETADDAASTSKHQIVFLSSKDKSKWANANTTLLLKQLKEELLIPPVSSKILAKTIAKQESVLVGLEASSNSSSNSSSSSSKSKDRRSKDENNDSTITVESARVDAGQVPAAKDGKDSSQSQEWQLRKRDRPNHKGKQRENRSAEAMEVEIQSRSGNGNKNDDGIKESEEIVAQPRSSKRRKVDHQDQRQQISDHEAAASPTASASDEPHSKKPFEKKFNSTNTPTSFARVDANGWFRAAPKNDHERSRWRQRASEAYQKETGSALEPSASTSGDPRIHIEAKTTSSSTTSRRSKGNKGNTNEHNRILQNNRNLPNFKRFRKNLVPIADSNEEVVLLLDAALSQASQAPRETSAEELELRENQRIAEALFRGEPGMGKKKRRVRN
jgi:hypothetical protein